MRWIHLISSVCISIPVGSWMVAMSTDHLSSFVSPSENQRHHMWNSTRSWIIQISQSRICVFQLAHEDATQTEPWTVESFCYKQANQLLGIFAWGERLGLFVLSQLQTISLPFTQPIRSTRSLGVYGSRRYSRLCVLVTEMPIYAPLVNSHIQSRAAWINYKFITRLIPFGVKRSIVMNFYRYPRPLSQCLTR